MGGYVTDITLKWVHGYRDCRGRMRYYVRRKGQPRIALPGLPGSKTFMDAYARAIAGEEIERPTGRCLSALFESYERSAAFVNLSDGSKNTYRKVLRPIRDRHGERGVADLPDDKARKLIEEMGETRPALANLTRAVLRNAFEHAIKLKWRYTNPFAGIQAYRMGTHHTWTDQQIAAYIARWPLGTRERMAFDLLYYTSQRVGDVAKMRRSDITGDVLYVKQQKTGTELHIQIHPALRRSMNAYGIKGQYLIGRLDGPFSAQSLSRVVSNAVAGAGLPPECVTHGIRKAVLRQLAERGVSTKVIQSLSGHKTLKEIERYTEKADQGRMVVAAIAALPHGEN